jgi:light-regulated signal transduction histidine kinase (bacteriophytochrome)
MNAREVDLTLCDREPIHIPGSIQPHGVMLVVDADSMRVTHAAGAVEARLGRADWLGASLADLLGETADADARRTTRGEPRRALDPIVPPGSQAMFDGHFYMSGGWLVVELEPREPRSSSAALLPQLEAAAAAFQRTPNLQQLFQSAAVEFRRLSGFDRVMVYRFLEDDAGVVVGEDAAPGQASFLNHHFPATDIPKQARALYVRNLVRVIPDVTYTPAPLVPAWDEPEPLDLSDSILRSVSPVHVQYLKNMGVAASASISIVKDGALWGLIACHHDSPRGIPPEVRSACRALAGGLSRQIKAREETDAYRERVRLRTFEDDIVALLLREGSLDEAISHHLDEFMRMLDADGVAVLRGSDLVRGGRCPPEARTRELAAWTVERASEKVYATECLADDYAMPEEDRRAAGLLAITLSAVEPWIVLWFRAEQLEVVNWAGNPHKGVATDARGALTPRASFAAWSETVRGRARRWTIPEIEAAGRLRTAVMGVWQTRRIRELNRELMNTIEEKELLIRQKEFLIGEVNHRVQNSLQLVSSFLALQARASDDPNFHATVEEARRRLTAVSLVHRRLYRADQLEAIDAARYLDELLGDLFSSMGEEWKPHVVSDLHPITLHTDRAVGLGLVVTELVINANKYAYGGGAGPLHITLAEDRNRFRLMVADEGVGRVSTRKGFGSRLLDALVRQLGGTLEFEDNEPGVRATLSAPIELPREPARPAAPTPS